MPLEHDHILKFLDDPLNDKFNLELIELLIKIINRLCFDECQLDRIQCTLTPLCTRRFLLKLRIKNGLPLDDLPKYCYSIQKNIVLRDLRNKTIVYKPFDAYLYIVDFLDIFFHGDYRKLNKFISFKNWDDVIKIFENRINERNENFQYYLTDKENYIIFKFEDRIHVICVKENFVLCNTNRENIFDLELLNGICVLYSKLYFPEAKVKLIPTKYVKVTTIVPSDVISKVRNTPDPSENSTLDDYFWENFPTDLDAISQYCKEINLKMKKNNDLEIKLRINLGTNNTIDKKRQLPLRFRDLRFLLSFIHRLYNDYYIIWVK